MYRFLLYDLILTHLVISLSVCLSVCLSSSVAPQADLPGSLHRHQQQYHRCSPLSRLPYFQHRVHPGTCFVFVLSTLCFPLRLFFSVTSSCLLTYLYLSVCLSLSHPSSQPTSFPSHHQPTSKPSKTPTFKPTATPSSAAPSYTPTYPTSQPSRYGTTLFFFPCVIRPFFSVATRSHTYQPIYLPPVTPPANPHRSHRIINRPQNQAISLHSDPQQYQPQPHHPIPPHHNPPGISHFFSSFYYPCIFFCRDYLSLIHLDMSICLSFSSYPTSSLPTSQPTCAPTSTPSQLPTPHPTTAAPTTCSCSEFTSDGGFDDGYTQTAWQGFVPNSDATAWVDYTGIAQSGSPHLPLHFSLNPPTKIYSNTHSYTSCHPPSNTLYHISL